MKDGKCSKYFPKKFNSGTVIDDDGYPIYKRRDDGSTVEKNAFYQSTSESEHLQDEMKMYYDYKFCFEAFDRTLRDILRFSNPSSCEKPFWGKVIVLEVISSKFFLLFLKGQDKILFLQLLILLIFGVLLRRDEKVLKVDTKCGDGDAGEKNDGEEIIEIPDEFLIKESTNPIASIVDSTYPSLIESYVVEALGGPQIVADVAPRSHLIAQAS
uniref:Uncharacterized protein n=1 Tax=Ananas comosus var. bracteatus TaxID=296719 RepID=A0A6V7Q0A6_ANACO|nr:unnamed protein product [Ananas comosus var. bracteatus]